jgi:hypothetical protein
MITGLTNIASSTTSNTVSISVGELAVLLVLVVLAIAGLAKIFQKADRAPWLVVVPFYNIYIFSEICGYPGWWGFAFLGLALLSAFSIAISYLVNITFGVIFGYGLCKKFNKNYFYIALITVAPFIAYPILGFGKAKYKKNSSKTKKPIEEDN